MEELHRAVYETTRDEWDTIEREHKNQLRYLIKPGDRILDCGCGYGRIINLMPDWWNGDYVGVDISEDLIHLAKIAYPKRRFVCDDLKRVSEEFREKQFDIAVFVSVEGMIKRHLGEEEWQLIYNSVCKVTKSVLFMDYDAEPRTVQL